ncbi:tRNA (adenosine(37)-N6)-dimethylallyltransferase MiaA [Candidatus Beckwithbacteria bacterium RBG_13_42_9]|uniref:tRNA dimethylallyltransferase n=1 Tax=Candidatus Beckwithbacteria bacterium RBG_13_42_9 TaxID=1797457 RepID=A0A1F5E5D6_9BACT|nr:MAG: tRNA (adenosine(37)-N6)-dimethylallyltransferase MiaA [Candidatus Beckwithbacteria bacterium RBG_13_42_9]
MNKLLIICGPTATGKSELGLKIAQKFNGEIVSADSRQVYKRMDIGTGKFLPGIKNLKFKIKNFKNLSKYKIGYFLIRNIPIWLLDIVEPDVKFSVALYQKIAQVVIEDVWSREKLPIVVGGTGLYIKSLIAPMATFGLAPDWKLRKKLENLDIEKLRAKLAEVDPRRLARMNDSDRNNPRRLIRAIEIANKTKNIGQRPISLWLKKLKIKNSNAKKDSSNVLIIGLRTKSIDKLDSRIDKRVEERIKAGAEKEVKKLVKLYGWHNSVLSTTIGYKEWRDYFVRKINLVTVKERWQLAEHAYARRQMTWFKKQNIDYWLNIESKSFDTKVVNIVQQYYGKG